MVTRRGGCETRLWRCSTFCGRWRCRWSTLGKIRELLAYRSLCLHSALLHALVSLVIICCPRDVARPFFGGGSKAPLRVIFFFFCVCLAWFCAVFPFFRPPVCFECMQGQCLTSFVTGPILFCFVEHRHPCPSRFVSVRLWVPSATA